MMRVVNKNEISEIENECFEKFFLNSDILIEKVGKQVCNFIQERFKDSINDYSFIFILGHSDNAADTLSAARELSNQGIETRVFFIGKKESASAQFKLQIERAKQFEVKGFEVDDPNYLEGFLIQNSKRNVIIDGITGTGLRLPLPEKIYSFINVINENSDLTISIDVPSGIDVNSGKVIGTAVDADITLAIGFPKIGCFLGEAVNFVGELITLDIGIPKKFNKGNKTLTNFEQVASLSKSRSKFKDKKFYGHTLLIGGSHGFVGSILLASEAALRVGVGAITSVTWEPQYSELGNRLIPEIKSGYIPIDDSKWDKLIQGLDVYNSIVIGPGLGVSARSRRLVHKILESYQGPIVLDADAINVLDIENDAALFQNRQAPTIMTPHFGELARFFKTSKEDIIENTMTYLNKAIDATNGIVVLKGACTFLGIPSEEIYLSYLPNSGMATGGVGDVLAGILGGLLAQDQNKTFESRLKSISKLEKTVLMGVMIHSKAGYFAANELGERFMTATSIINSLPEAFKELEKYA